MSLEHRKNVGWQVENLAFGQIVVGVQHVDDCILFSRIWCEDCMFKHLQATWPTDVGCSKEGGGKCVQMLNSVIVIENAQVFVYPHNPNIAHETVNTV